MPPSVPYSGGFPDRLRRERGCLCDAARRSFTMCGRRLVRLTLVLFVAACASARVSGPPTKIGDPLPGLTPAELTRFQAGKGIFQRTFDAAHGLGPLFNSTSCAECHEQPVVGGGGKGEVGGDD